MVIAWHLCKRRNIYEDNCGYPITTCYTNRILHFLRRVRPGTCIVLQYDSQRPTTATFQGLQHGAIMLSGLIAFPDSHTSDSCDECDFPLFSN